ncbi:proline iminopeptidase-family hydrolase [uncultured Eudoraea sp.]|uniref:proline iminopeptidase-family hydrolase n=1 Tax=uncultured Eudoraea sp. TaxID=1035614 RepID=UPI00263100A5|nr:proline iminopeptidase-family hydrolase [uncultured Eudoraea sp.]
MKRLQINLWTVLAILILMVVGCESKTRLISGEGYTEVKGGQIWYRIVGDSDKTPLLLVHGGPGFPSYYLNPLKELGKDRPVIFYDQLGCGRSETEVDSTLMTVENFVEQLETLRVNLGLEKFYLYGHSWGTMLGMDYYLKYPDRVKALIFASPALSISKWTEDTAELIKTLPDSIQSAIKVNNENGTYDSPEYQQAINVFYENFVAKKLPWDANMDSTFTGANMNVYNYMWGPSEFNATGILEDYERGEQLKEIEIPTLFVCGEFDEARPSTVRHFQSLVPNSKMVVIEDAAHISMHDNPDENNQAIRDFLLELEN